MAKQAYRIATSADVPGLVVEADTVAAHDRGGDALSFPNLWIYKGHGHDDLSLTFKAEERLDVAGA